MESIQPKLVLVSVPFPGNLYAAFRSAQFIKAHFPDTKIAMGGGFPNTELRSLSDARVFEFFDFITLDDGELPVELLCEAVSSATFDGQYKRTFLLEDGKVAYKHIGEITAENLKQKLLPAIEAAKKASAEAPAK